MRDDPLRNLAVVQAVKDVPQLYERDTGIPKKELERLWNQVGAKVDLPGMNARDRWRIIRGSYVRYLRTLETDSGQNKEYYLAKYLDFLRPFLKIRESGGASRTIKVEASPAPPPSIKPQQKASVNKPKERASPRKRRREEEEEEQEFHIQQDGEIVVNNIYGTDEEEEALEVITENAYSEVGATPTMHGSSLTYTLRNGQLIEPRMETTSVVHEVVEEDNGDLMFFKSLMSDMATLSSKKKNKFKLTVMSALVDLMDD